MSAIREVWDAIEEADVDGVRALLQQHPEVLNATDERGFTPLIYAASCVERQESIVRALIEEGAEVNRQTAEGYAALHLAVEDADTVWQQALDAGAKVFEPLHDAFWGDRTGQFIDPFGHRWAIDQHIRDVPPDEVARLAAEAFAGGPG